jgi:hypothetical protein
VRGRAWIEKGDARIDLPAVDLPVSRTGLLVHHSPRFDVEPQPGAFRSEANQTPWSGALRNDVVSVAEMSSSAPPLPSSDAERESANIQALIAQFRQEMGKTTAGVVPVHVSVPEVGPSLFVAAELTAESHAPSLELHYKRLSGR